MNKFPNEATRFPINRQNHTKKGPYLTPLLKRFLNKKIDYIDPETNRKIQGRVKDALLWRLLLNGCQGENDAIREILNRIDGKIPQKLVGEGFNGDTRIVIVYPQDWKPKEEHIGNKTQEFSS